MESQRYMLILSGIALCNCESFESQYTFVMFTFKLFVCQRIEVLFLFHLL